MWFWICKRLICTSLRNAACCKTRNFCHFSENKNSRQLPVPPWALTELIHRMALYCDACHSTICWTLDFSLGICAFFLLPARFKLLICTCGIFASIHFYEIKRYNVFSQFQLKRLKFCLKSKLKWNFGWIRNLNSSFIYESVSQKWELIKRNILRTHWLSSFWFSISALLPFRKAHVFVWIRFSKTWPLILVAIVLVLLRIHACELFIERFAVQYIMHMYTVVVRQSTDVNRGSCSGKICIVLILIGIRKNSGHTAASEWQQRGHCEWQSIAIAICRWGDTNPWNGQRSCDYAFLKMAVCNWCYL